jgi:hypothetical protein
MNGLVRHFIPRLDDHLSDDRMASLLCHELSMAERLIAKQHLTQCGHCRMRKQDLEGRRADRMLSLYRDAIHREELPSPEGPRAELIRRVRLEIERSRPRPWWDLRLPHGLTSINASIAASVLLGLCGVTCVFWWQHWTSNVSPDALLKRAERWDAPGVADSHGVVFQAVRITTPDQTMEHSIYRDVQGKRLTRRTKLNAAEDRLKSKLAQAGLDWDEPISASSYQGWHDQQHRLEDKVVRDEAHLLTLTTTVPNGSIAEETLTVRDTDFHPVRRTIAFRDRGTVEIAELDYKILPWSQVDGSVFESAGSGETAMATDPAPVLSLPRMPDTLTEEQLEETELGARLILNQLHADTGAQIEISRVPQGVEVKGLVEKEALKQTLQRELRSVPHLNVAIQSVEELNHHPVADDATNVVRTESMPDQPSPLETYLLSSGRGIDVINFLAQRLFDSALTISQESKAIGDLQSRFVSGDRRSIIASATLSELIYSHRERLEAALKREQALLSEARGVAVGDAAISVSTPSLMEAASKNLALCKELTQTAGPAPRGGDKILAEMSASTLDIHRGMREMYAKAGTGDTTSDGKK